MCTIELRDDFGSASLTTEAAVHGSVRARSAMAYSFEWDEDLPLFSTIPNIPSENREKS
jgi:hypothetical protein